MKKMLIALGLVLASTTVFAADKKADVNFTEQWFCSGYGTLNIGGPAGSITMPVQGRGETQLEAMSNAQQNCFSQGLQMCMINNCYKR
ncbi:MAG: hypothetical protein H7177_11965 [Rhizobacter sp.]|nr:hypothetical protein [Bacteriovorax sp.]